MANEETIKPEAEVKGGRREEACSASVGLSAALSAVTAVGVVVLVVVLLQIL
jgi:hypothetical protein